MHVCVCKRVIHYCLCQTSVCGCTRVSPTNGLDTAQFGSCVLQFLLARNQPLMSHLVEVDDCEAVCLSGPHVLYTEEEPLSVLVCVEIKTKVEFIVPSTTGGGGGGGERHGGGRGHHPHTPLPHSTHTSPSYITPTLPSYTPSHITTHTCTAFARLPLSNRDSNTKVVLSGGKVGVAFGVMLGPARARVNCTKDANHQLLSSLTIKSTQSLGFCPNFVL